MIHYLTPYRLFAKEITIICYPASMSLDERKHLFSKTLRYDVRKIGSYNSFISWSNSEHIVDINRRFDTSTVLATKKFMDNTCRALIEQQPRTPSDNFYVRGTFCYSGK
jgi:hypothetical protein